MRLLPAVLLVSALLVPACVQAADDIQDPVAGEESPEPIHEAIDDRCERAPDDLVTALEEGLSIPGELGDAFTVESEELEDLHFVSAQLLSEEVADSEPPIPTWALVGEEPADGEILSVSSAARTYSDFPPGDDTEMRLSMGHDGGEESKICVEAAEELD